MIDDFFKCEQPAAKLNIIFTTRSSRKSEVTLRALNSHLRNGHRSATDISRVTFHPEHVDLTNLRSIVALARRLNSSALTHIDVVVCNAGMGGWSGLNWFQAVYTILTDIKNATTWPAFKLGIVGAVTKPQLASSDSEPPLGEIFCANLFGHYMLAHWLMPLLRAPFSVRPAKVIWVSSNEPDAYHFDENDFQGLQTDAAYEHSKRMTDLISLTADLPSTRQEFESYIAIPAPASSTSIQSDQTSTARLVRSRPIFQVCQPGTAVTTFFSLIWILQQGYLLGIYLARICGSVWATVDPHKAALAPTWLALLNWNSIRDAEIRAATVPGKIKWGTATDRWANFSVRPTEVPGWGVNGSGLPYLEKWWGGKNGDGRKPEWKEVMKADVDNFVAQGGRVWKEMEKLRVEWEARILEAERSETKKS